MDKTNLKPGMLCRIAGATFEGNNGKVVELIRYWGTPPGSPKDFGVIFGQWGGRGWWETDGLVTCVSEDGLDKIQCPYARERILHPIDEDHQPADEDWQAEFNRMLSSTKESVK